MPYRIQVKTVDVFILKEFLWTMAFVFSLFLAIAFVMVLFDELEVMRTHQASFRLGIIYVLLRLPHEIVRASPMVVVLSMMISIGNLIRHNEMLILNIVGYSPLRLAAPLATALGVLILGLMVFYESVCGPLANQAHTFMEMRIKGSPQGLAGDSGIWLYGEKDRIYRARDFFPYTREIRGLSIFEFAGAERKNPVRLDAEVAVWNPSVGGWNLKNVVARTIQEDGSVKRDLYPSYFYYFASPDDFARVTLEPEQMSRSDLARLIASIRNAGQDPRHYLPDLRIKEAFPFAVFFLGMLAYGGTLYLGMAGRVSGVGIGLVIVIFYFMSLSLGESLAKKDLIYPWLGAWAPNLIALGLSIYVFRRLKEEV